MKLGLYRLTDPFLGEAARVHKSAGDAAPYLSRFVYELLGFEPKFDALPTLPDFIAIRNRSEEAPASQDFRASKPRPAYAEAAH